MAKSFEIKNHRLLQDGHQASFIESPHQSATFAPRGIILHDTAGQLTKHSSVNWFKSPDAHSSAHVVVERDGSITQMVRLNRRAWHAGKSIYKASKDVNGFAFGIEIVNVGKCKKADDGSFIPWFKTPFKQGTNGLRFEYAKTASHGQGWWLDYTEEQIETVKALCDVLVAKYRLDFITTHWDISPGRKVDTNPLFPLDEIRASAFDDNDGADGRAFILTDANMRRWPSYNDNIIMVVPKGSQVVILRSGSYQYEKNEPETWHLIELGTQQGWIHGSLVQL